MSQQAVSIENEIDAALRAPTLVAGRVDRGDAFALPIQLQDGVLIRLTALLSLDADLDEVSALARWGCEIELQGRGAVGQSAAQGLASLATAVHTRLMANKTLGGFAQRIEIQQDSPLVFKTDVGGESPVFGAIMRYEIHSNINPQTLGA